MFGAIYDMGQNQLSVRLCNDTSTLRTIARNQRNQYASLFASSPCKMISYVCIIVNQPPRSRSNVYRLPPLDNPNNLCTSGERVC